MRQRRVLEQGLIRAAGLGLALAISAAVSAEPAPDIAPASGTGKSVEWMGEVGDDSCFECEHGCAHAKQMMGRFGRGLPLLDRPAGPGGVAQNATPEDLLTDLLHYDLAIQINPTAQTIVGVNELTLLSKAEGLTQFTFRLQNNYSIPSVLVDGATASWTRLDSIRVRVDLGRAYAMDEEFRVTVSYSGVPINNGFDAILFSTHAGASIVSTLSETDFAYTWFPVKDDNRDKATADLRFTVPTGQTVASNGLLQGVTDLGGGWSQWYWKTQELTATYLFSFAVTNYTRFSSSFVHANGTMPLEFFIYPENDTTGNRNAWLATGQMLATYAPLFGPYPFLNEKYGVYQFPFGGGMEHQTMTGQGTFNESVTAHELAHQWWGDNVTAAFWNDIWLNEGFATYTEALWFENKPGSTGAPALHAAMAARRPASVNGTVYKFEPLNSADLATIFSTSFSYRKPSWVLHMLRHVVGDQTFFDILAAYRATFQGKGATSEDFRATAEAVAGQDLSWFFTQWIYQPGAPAYQSAWRTFAVNGKSFVELYLKQVQSTQFPIFTMPVDIVSTVAGSPVTNIVWNNAAAEHFVFPVSAAPTLVRVDPTPWILATSNTTTTFVQGPPKVVEVSPAPGAELQISQMGDISVWFSKDVAAQPARFTLTGASTGTIPFTMLYDSASLLATLTPLSPLGADVYTLTVLDTLTDVASAKALDGEVNSATDPASLPSGDGLPGGSLSVEFRVAPPACTGDASGDGIVNFTDITAVLSNWGGAGPAPQPGDADGDGVVNFQDITAALSNWGAVCGG